MHTYNKHNMYTLCIRTLSSYIKNNDDIKRNISLNKLHFHFHLTNE